AAAGDAVIAGLAQLDLVARRFEIANLPNAARPALGNVSLEACSAALVAFDKQTPERRTAILDRTGVPDAYSPWKRALGLYPLTSIPFRWGVSRWEAATQEAFAQPSAALAKLWSPPPATASLLERHAPVFEIDTRTTDDRFGMPQWTADGIAIDTIAPVVFTHVAHTRFAGDSLVQLTYLLWFPARPRSGFVDLLSGTLDGLVFRITLDRDGEVMVADSIHACGCYHLFFPSSRLTARPAPDAHQEWAFSPATLPALSLGQRLRVRVAAGTHYVTGLFAAPQDTAGAQAYTLRPLDELRSLPLPGGRERRSLYGPDGLVDGSERGERFLFWPMGIASPGAMRQWGHHATAFVGRRHFDEPDLLERRFARVAGPATAKVQ
ncbi:MAG: hypothetical protein JNK75_01820, partial [Betaproteobacteria bacterium]|nr:hypothetical protein [Betaproteobacteria bacterium]